MPVTLTPVRSKTARRKLAQPMHECVSTFLPPAPHLLLHAATGNIVTSITQPTAVPTKLPQCRTTSLLTSAGGFPDNWATLTAQQQASHPINLPMMQVCASSTRTSGTHSCHPVACMCSPPPRPACARRGRARVPARASDNVC